MMKLTLTLKDGQFTLIGDTSENFLEQLQDMTLAKTCINDVFVLRAIHNSQRVIGLTSEVFNTYDLKTEVYYLWEMKIFPSLTGYSIKDITLIMSDDELSKVMNSTIARLHMVS